MSMNAQHTPTPYRVATVKSFSRVLVSIIGADGVTVARTCPPHMLGVTSLTNAEFIVAACNSYDELTAEVAGLRAALERMTSAYAEGRNDTSEQHMAHMQAGAALAGKDGAK